MNRSKLHYALATWVWPFLLWFFTWLIGGFHYETNDDLLMSFIVRGIAFGEPVGDLSLYFHGFGHLFVALYRQFPAIPWYGLILYFLLFIATHLAFRVIYRQLKPRFSFAAISGILILFYLANWYEHAFWFNYMRVPMLLSGLVLLNAFPAGTNSEKPRTRVLIWYAFLFFLALCIRPGAALLGIMLVAPVLVLGAFKSSNFGVFTAKLLPFAIAGIAFLIFLQISSGKDVTGYRQTDTLKSGILDYQWCCGPKEEPESKLIMAGLSQWFVADPKVWTGYLEQENIYPDWPYLLKEAFTIKLPQAIKALVFDQFLILSLIFGLLFLYYRQKSEAGFSFIIWVQVYFWLAIFGMAVFLKMPPRVLTPALGFLFLVNLSFISFETNLFKSFPVILKVLLGLLIGLQIFKVANRMQWQKQLQANSESFLENLHSGYQNKIIVTANIGGELRALSPFQNYDVGLNQLFMITGWQTLDPHFEKYCQKLTNQENVIAALKVLCQKENAVWIMQPEFRAFLEQYGAHFYNGGQSFKSLSEIKPIPNSTFKVYSR